MCGRHFPTVFACLLFAAVRPARAVTPVVEGSSLTTRTFVDGDSGQVFIYIGGAFPQGTTLSTFKFLFDRTGPQANTSGFITPLLFTREIRGTQVIYAVAGIGHGFQVSLNAAPAT